MTHPSQCIIPPPILLRWLAPTPLLTCSEIAVVMLFFHAYIYI